MPGLGSEVAGIEKERSFYEGSEGTSGTTRRGGRSVENIGKKGGRGEVD